MSIQSQNQAHDLKPVQPEELNKLSVPSAHLFTKTPTTYGVVQGIVGALSVLLTTSPAFGAPGKVETSAVNWGDWSINTPVVIAAAVAAAGWIAYGISRFQISERDYDAGLKDKTIKNHEATIKQFQTNLAARGEAYKSLVECIGSLSEEQALSVIRDIFAKAVPHMNPNELVSVIGVLPEKGLVALLREFASDQPITQQLMQALPKVDQKKQIAVFCDLFMSGADTVLLKIWPHSTYGAPSAVITTSATKLAEVIKQDLTMLSRAAHSEYPVFRRKAVELLDKGSQPTLLAQLLKDSDPTVRDSACQKWIDQSTSCGELLDFIQNGGPLARGRALEMFPSIIPHDQRPRLLEVLQKTSDTAARHQLAEKTFLSMTAEELEQLSKTRPDTPLAWKYYAHPAASGETAARFIAPALTRIKVVDVPEEGYTTDYQYSSEYTVTRAEVSHEELKNDEVGKVLNELMKWNEQKASEFIKSMTQGEIGVLFTPHVRDLQRTIRIAKLKAHMHEQSGNLVGERVCELAKILGPEGTASFIQKELGSNKLGAFISALPADQAHEIVKLLPTDFVTNSIQALHGHDRRSAAGS